MTVSRPRRHTTRVAEIALWAVGLLCGGTAAVVWNAHSAPIPVPALSDALRPAPAEPRADPAAANAAAALLAEQDPFRATHRPALVAYGAPPPRPVMPPGVGATAAPPFAPPRPRLSLLGIVGGAGRWEAVLAGVTGREGGTLVRAGDTLSGLHVRRVTGDSLVVQERDTVWRLTLGARARP